MLTVSKDKNMDNGSKKERTVFSRIVKYLIIGISSVIVLLLVFAFWIYLALFSGPGSMEINDYHPFRSEKAKAEYLDFEDNMTKMWPIVSEEKIVETSFGKTFIRISGPINAPPLVLLPGGGTNSIIWHANIKALSDNYRTYALDNIYDYGRSVYTREMKNGADCANWLNELFDALQLGNDIRIMGYSYGGWVTSQYALYHPERLSHIVLIAPVFTVIPLSTDYIFRMLASIIPVRHFKSEIMYWCWSDLAKTGDIGKQLIENRIDHYETALKTFKFKQPVNPTVLTDSEFRKIEVPTLFVVGDHETIYSADSAVSRINKLNPKIKTEIISGTGHDVMFTHTDILNQMLLDFFITNEDDKIYLNKDLR